MTPVAWPRRFLARIVGASLLSSQTYESVAKDRTAFADGAVILALACAASGVGAIGLSIEELNGGAGPVFVSGFLSNLMTWGLWTFAAIVVAALFVQIMPETHVLLGFLRTSLLAQAPVLFRVLGLVPVFDQWAIILILAWQFAAMTVAVRQGFGF
ncbi:MAG: hypothetical protein O2854_06545, partial [Chloroflexi bacterium]|nr:hypothetical protein [Chloroflexota bacterium]